MRKVLSLHNKKLRLDAHPSLYTQFFGKIHIEEKHIEKKLRKMASLTLIISLPKFGPAGSAIVRRSTWNPRLFAASTPRPIQVSHVS